MMPAPELTSQSIPEQLHELDAIHRAVSVGAAYVLVQVSAHLGHLEIYRVGIEVDQAARHITLDDLPDTWIGYGCENAVGETVFRVGQDRAILPGNRIACHGFGNSPEQVAPCQHLAHAHLHAPKILCPAGLYRLQEESREEIQLNGKAHAAVKGRAWDEPRGGEEVVRFLYISIHEDAVPGYKHLVENKYRVVLIQPA